MEIRRQVHKPLNFPLGTSCTHLRIVKERPTNDIHALLFWDQRDCIQGRRCYRPLSSILTLIRRKESGGLGQSSISQNTLGVLIEMKGFTTMSIRKTSAGVAAGTSEGSNRPPGRREEKRGANGKRRWGGGGLAACGRAKSGAWPRPAKGRGGGAPHELNGTAGLPEPTRKGHQPGKRVMRGAKRGGKD